eukprot:TRINITY_DN2952_c0_g1_i8.p1 TRINITY_DN2952_c0_g1~~TRINITY_DN2952_c0_g1_i8.p1  ORF type:complete len:194 (+),score=20.86 TRINITY_DN2952_c0_g1_i8:3-584(+)
MYQHLQFTCVFTVGFRYLVFFSLLLFSMFNKVCVGFCLFFFFFFFSSRRRHTRCREVSWARRCVQETGIMMKDKKVKSFLYLHNHYVLHFHLIDIPNNILIITAFRTLWWLAYRHRVPVMLLKRGSRRRPFSFVLKRIKGFRQICPNSRPILTILNFFPHCNFIKEDHCSIFRIRVSCIINCLRQHIGVENSV